MQTAAQVETVFAAPPIVPVGTKSLGTLVARYQVQAEESDCSLTDCGEPHASKRNAVRVARHLARTCPHNTLNYLVFDNREESFVFVAKVRPVKTEG